MDVTIRIIQVGELERFINSEEYNRFSFFPISTYRAISHAHNPRADKTDHTIFLAYVNDTLVGYLGAIPDYIINGNHIIKVYWLSCMWVLPEYRRHGIASKLLQESYDKCNGKILITNYIPRSKSAFLKTGIYIEHAVLQGLRSYLFLNLSRIIISKYPKMRWIKPILYAVDKSLNLFFLIRLKYLLRNSVTENQFNILDKIDNETKQFIDENNGRSPFKRSASEFQWMIDFPWVKRIREPGPDPLKYYFSQIDKDFTQWFICIKDKTGKIIGFIILTRHKQLLKIPYIFCGDSLFNDIILFVVNLMYDLKIPTLICHHPRVVSALKNHSRYFITQHKSQHGFIVSKKMTALLGNEQLQYQEGDGDGAFT